MRISSDNPQRSLGSTPRGLALLRESENAVHQRTDGLFANLMTFQWLAGIAAALWISPLTWVGAQSSIHLHVYAAIFIGGLIAGFPIFLARTRPGWWFTRHVVAAGQMCTSALLVHLAGGRIETHFHIFGSLAFLAIYRDWRVLVTATIVTAADHFARGMFWPQSVFGIVTASPWRWLEHAAWVVFEDVFLIISVRQSVREMAKTAERQARLETVNIEIERQVVARTAELEKVHREMVDISRQAGMAEVATAVLHNVGNVLNSVNVASACVAASLRNSKASSLSRVVGMLREHQSDLGAFFSSDTRGKQLPGFLAQLSERLAAERSGALQELTHLEKNIEHIKEIVSMQQTYAKVSGIKESLQVTDLVEDTLRMNAGSYAHHQVQVVRDFAEVSPVCVEKHKVLQILVNLLRNAKHACEESDRSNRTIMVRVFHDEGTVKVAVQDNGVGIPPENLTRIFNHGFTTKKNGHGFGLHSGALAALEMGGALRVHSDGPGTGATFTLELPAITTAQPSILEHSFV